MDRERILVAQGACSTDGESAAADSGGARVGVGLIENESATAQLGESEGARSDSAGILNHLVESLGPRRIACVNGEGRA